MLPTQVRSIVSHLTEDIEATASELSSLLGLDMAETENILADLRSKEIVTTENGVYKLKS